MARIHSTIHIPVGGSYPSLGALLGNGMYISREERKPSFFGPEIDKISEDFERKVVNPILRRNYYVQPIVSKLLRSES